MHRVGRIMLKQAHTTLIDGIGTIREDYQTRSVVHSDPVDP